jgi:hypothetical protein
LLFFDTVFYLSSCFSDSSRRKLAPAEREIAHVGTEGVN